MLLLRHIRHAAALNVVALIFCAANLHAAWNLKFPFYHEDQSPAPPATFAPAPKAQAPVEIPVTGSLVPKEAATEAPSLPLPAIDNAPQPAPPLPASPVKEDVQPNPRLAPFEGALRIPVTAYTEDTIWQGRVQLDGWITIAPQSTLTIAPGTIIRVATGSGINVLGRIVVKGTADAPVTVSSLHIEPAPGQWRGIILTGSEKKNILENLRIEGAETGLLARYSSFASRGITVTRSVTGLHLQECVAGMTDSRISGSATGIAAEHSEMTIEKALIESNGTGIFLTNSALFAIDATLVDNRSIGLNADDSRLKLDRFLVNGSETGARISRSDGSVSDSSFRDNIEAGAVLSGSRLKVSGTLFSGNRIGLQVDDHLPVLWNNALFNNKSYNLLYMGEKSYFAGGNWFGHGEKVTVERTLFSNRAGALQTEPYLGNNPVNRD